MKKTLAILFFWLVKMKETSTVLKRVAIEKLIPYANNSRLHSDEQVLQIGCEKTNRRAYLMELDPKYCDVIINRWQTLTGKEAVLESTGEKFNG